ncbi:hypothetical protein [uncultured Hymenobacter sp.]|uniref:hypothetical protein n=1 Tax=uncultured Hymenobacter sp. TaxID=170016 RepID=UPI0035CAB1B5
MSTRAIFSAVVAGCLPIVPSRNRGPVVSWLAGCTLALLASPLAAAGQQLEAVGAAVSGNVTQTLATPKVIPILPYALATDEDLSRYDEVGYRLSAYARWQVGDSRFFAQPELAYTSTRGQSYLVLYDLNGPIGPSYSTFGHRIWRWEAAALGGLRTSRRTYVLAGPVLVVNRRDALLEVRPTSPPDPPTATIYNSLNQSVERLQVLGQVGVGFVAGRFDFNLRYEQSLTPYSRRFLFENNVYPYRQHLRQGIFTVGFLAYKKKS